LNSLIYLKTNIQMNYLK